MICWTPTVEREPARSLLGAALPRPTPTPTPAQLLDALHRQYNALNFRNRCEVKAYFTHLRERRAPTFIPQEGKDKHGPRQSRTR